jgi:hypothetical protein
MAKNKSQQQKLYNYLRKYGVITAKQALNKFGTKNLRARINDLRLSGWDIVSERNPRDTKTVVYRVLSAQ